MKIVPTNGRVILFKPDLLDREIAWDGRQLLAATVCHVHSEHMVNLSVIDANGLRHQRTSVGIVQDESPHVAGNGAHAEWMPYQVGQAKKNA